MSDLPSRLGRYEVLRPLARGGMSEVYLARATGPGGFEKLVVLKRILPRFAKNKQFRDMFLDEARIAASLDHPGIAQIFDIAEVDGAPLVIMEYLRGADLRAVIEAVEDVGHAVPLDAAVTIVLSVLDALHHVHERPGPDGKPLRIVHRDVSPPNVFVTTDGGVKLLDFGVAKAEGRLGEETQEGMVKGKLRYLSPEQARRSNVDRRSDLFSLSVVLWELTVGEGLYQGDSAYAVMKLLADKDARPPSSVLSRYPRELERIVLKGLRRDPDMRYQTAEEMQIELEAFARAENLVVSPITVRLLMAHLFPPRVERARALAIAAPPADAMTPATIDSQVDSIIRKVERPQVESGELVLDPPTEEEP